MDDGGVALLSRVARLAAILLCWFLLRGAGAAEPAQDVDAPSAIDTAAVSVDGVELFRVAGARSLPSAQRARGVSERIIAVARDPAAAVPAIGTRPAVGHIDVVAGEQHLVAVIDSDAALERVPVAVVAQLRAARIQQAIERYRAERGSSYLRQAAQAAAIATAVLLVALFAVLRLFKRVLEWLPKRLHSRIHGLKVHSYEV